MRKLNAWAIAVLAGIFMVPGTVWAAQAAVEAACCCCAGCSSCPLCPF